MKRLLIGFGSLLVALYLGSVPASAQHGSRPTNPGMSGATHGPSSHDSSTATGKSTSESASSPSTPLSHNATALAKALTNSGIQMTADQLKSDCMGFKNLGRCIAALHVGKNLGIPFDCLKADMLDTTSVIDGATCPPGTGTGPKKLSLGQSIQALDPKADAKPEASKAIKQANADIKSAKS